MRTGVVTIALLIATPIAYTPEMVPPALRLLIYVNPLAYFVVSYQHILVLGELPQPEILVGAIVLGVVPFCGAFHVFQRAKRTFFDHA